MSFADTTPILALAPYQTSMSTLSAQQQNLQQFPQHVSNPPGQTVDYFFNYLSVLTNVSQYFVDQTRNDANFNTLNTYVRTLILHLRSIRQAVNAKYADNPRWSSPILPYPGYAANNAVNSGGNPFNVATFKLIATAGSSWFAFYPVYWWLRGLNNEVVNSSAQINHYTYDFLVSTSVTLVPIGGGAPTTQSVAQWIQDDFATLEIEYENSPQYTQRTNASSTYNLLVSVVDGVTIASGDIIDRIPITYLLAPLTNTVLGTGSEAINLINSSPLVIFIILGGLLFNTLTSISPALDKLSPLYDASGNYVFETAALKVATATTTYTTLLSTVASTITVTPDDGDVTKTPLSVDVFYKAQTYTLKNARTSSVDLNRINGSLVPTLNRVKQLWSTYQTVASSIQSSSAYGNYSTSFKNAIQAVVANTSITTDLTLAVDSFDSQLDIHYSRWSQNLTNI